MDFRRKAQGIPLNWFRIVVSSIEESLRGLKQRVSDLTSLTGPSLSQFPDTPWTLDTRDLGVAPSRNLDPQNCVHLRVWTT